MGDPRLRHGTTIASVLPTIAKLWAACSATTSSRTIPSTHDGLRRGMAAFLLKAPSYLGLRASPNGGPFVEMNLTGEPPLG
jgi:hypothetical protein